MIAPKYYPPLFNMYRYSQINPTANAWASNLNNRWEMIKLINDGESEGVIHHLTEFYKQHPSREPVITEEEKASYVDYDYSCWSRAASPLIVADADYFACAVMNIKQECLKTTPIAKVVPNLSNLHNYLNVDLKAPDDIIMESVKRYIAHARTELKMESVKKRISTSKLISWNRILLLPYLDLMIWLRASGLTLEKSDIAKLLYRHGEGYKRGDTTIRFAKDLFGENLKYRTDFLETLTVQGIYEADENRAVNELLNKGMSARRVAEKLKLTVKAVESHKKYLF